MPQHTPTQRSSQPTHAPEGDDATTDAAALGDDDAASDDAELTEFRQWKRSQANANVAATAAAKPVKEPDPFDLDDHVTLLLPAIYRAVIEGRESKGHRAYIAAERPGPIDEDTGKAGRSLVLTLTFVGGVCPDVPYSVVKALKKTSAYRSNDALKVVPLDTPETQYAKLCGVQPLPAQKMAALLLASDLDAVLADFDTEQLRVFTEALSRRARTAPGTAPGAASGTPQSGILNTQSFQRG